jgi:hypothetical protein
MSDYYGDCWILYMAMLERMDGLPKRVLKIGITNAKHPLYRLEYRGADEPYPITNYFQDITIIKTKEFKTKEEAEKNERRVMGMVKRKFKSPYFHDWLEEDRISGITEMRTWRDEEAEYVKVIL